MMAKDRRENVGGAGVRAGVRALAMAVVAVMALTAVAMGETPPPPSGGGGQVAGSDAPAADLAGRRVVAELRIELRLRDESLAAMGLSQAGAEGVLTRLQTWSAANHPAWLAKRKAVAVAWSELRRAEKRAVDGPRDPVRVESMWAGGDSELSRPAGR